MWSNVKRLNLYVLCELLWLKLHLSWIALKGKEVLDNLGFQVVKRLQNLSSDFHLLLLHSVVMTEYSVCHLQDIHSTITLTYNLPVWVSYVIFAVTVIVAGFILALVSTSRHVTFLIKTISVQFNNFIAEQ